MMGNREFNGERIQRIDPTTGIKVIQLTSYPLPSAHPYYDWPSITPDNRRMLIYCQRFLRRRAPWDIFRVDTDGGGALFQLTEYGETETEGGYYGRPWAVLSLDGQYVYVNAVQKLFRIEMETGEEELIADLESYWKEGYILSRMTLSASGKRIFIQRSRPIERRGMDFDLPEPDWLIVSLETGAAEPSEGRGSILGCAYEANGLLVNRGIVKYETVVKEDGTRTFRNPDGQGEVWLVDEKGNNGRSLGENVYAHGTNLGRKAMMQGTGLPPHRCIWIGEPDKEPRKLMEGPYCWHSGASFDAEWIVTDTNWPDQGLQLIHVPTGNYRTLCHAGASQDAVEYGHPHPYLSQDGRLAVFRSDRTGASQVYIAHTTDEFRESIIAGELDRPKDKWFM